jgi:hypothetical protein
MEKVGINLPLDPHGDMIIKKYASKKYFNCFVVFQLHNFTRYDNNLYWLIDKTSVIISINYEYNNENKKKI